MKRMMLASLVMVAAFLLVTAAVSSPHLVTGEGEKYNLSDLYDGETRVFGEGEHKVTATRDGDTITIKIGAGGVDGKSFTCSVGTDSCYIVTADGEGASKIAIIKSHTDEDGEAVMSMEDVFVMAAGEGEAHTWIAADCDKPCDHTATVHLEAAEALEGLPHLITTVDAHPHGNVIQIGKPDGGVSLRCPEGDTTMVLKKEEKDGGPYFCPRHNVQLEEVKAKKIMIQEMEIGKPHEEDE